MDKTDLPWAWKDRYHTGPHSINKLAPAALVAWGFGPVRGFRYRLREWRRIFPARLQTYSQPCDAAGVPYCEGDGLPLWAVFVATDHHGPRAFAQKPRWDAGWYSSAPAEPVGDYWRHRGHHAFSLYRVRRGS